MIGLQVFEVNYVCGFSSRIQCIQQFKQNKVADWVDSYLLRIEPM